MSGGSYDYLYAKEVDQILSATETLDSMAQRLEGLDMAGAATAAVETRAIIAEIRRFEDDIRRRSARLRDVWMEVEWWDSSDGSRGAVERVLAKYHAENQPIVEGPIECPHGTPYRYNCEQCDPPETVTIGAHDPSCPDCRTAMEASRAWLMDLSGAVPAPMVTVTPGHPHLGITPEPPTERLFGCYNQPGVTFTPEQRAKLLALKRPDGPQSPVKWTGMDEVGER